MYVTFRCPVTNQTVEASGHLEKRDTLGGRVAQSAKRSVMWSLRAALSRTVYRTFGYGIAGHVASDVAYGATSNVGYSSSQSYSDEEKRQAIVRAFESVLGQFAWDAANQRYISAQAAGEVMTDFMRQLGSAPVIAPYDRGVLARMLTEIACADGTIGNDERQFLAGFLTPEVGTVDSLAQMKRLSPAELAETSRGVRETMLMLCWALALTDENLATDEAIRLNDYATGLTVPAQRAHELRSYAQVYLVDQALGRAYSGGRRDPAIHDEVMGMARRLGMDPNEAERVDIRFRKRYGLV